MNSQRILGLSLLVMGMSSATVMAHGTMFDPLSRVYFCSTRTNFVDPGMHSSPENMQDDACEAAKQIDGTLPFYDPYAQAQASANSRHQEVVPDGKLCSGNAAWYKGMDLVRDDWSATPMEAGEYRFRFMATASHSTKDWTFYITKPGYANEALAWSDLESFCTMGAVPLLTDPAYKEPIYEFDCVVPERFGKHVIYNTWQRSDSGEAFYTCMDVMFPQQGSNWLPKENLHANKRLQVGERVRFNHLAANGNVLDSVTITLDSSNLQPGTWARDLAIAVNSQMANVRLGEETPYGEFVPQRSDWGNLVYFNSADTRYSLEFLPVDPNAPVPTSTPIDNGGCAAPWDSAATYNQPDKVYFNGYQYRAKYWNKGDQPDNNHGQGFPWERLEACNPNNTQPSPSVSVTVTPEPTATVTLVPSPSVTVTPEPSPSTTPSPSPTVTLIPSPSASPSTSPSPSASPSTSPSVTPEPAPIRVGSLPFAGFLLLMLAMIGYRRRH